MQMLEEGGNYPRPKQFRALILTPTRELAEQIDSNIALFGRSMDLSHCKIYGGVSQSPQVKLLANGVDILVATPGRLLDLFNQRKLEFGGVEFLVLDEADRMLDMGFINDIRKICRELPKKRQSLLFSATLSKEVEALAKNIVDNPEKISVSPDKPTVDKIAAKGRVREPRKQVRPARTHDESAARKIGGFARADFLPHKTRRKQAGKTSLPNRD